MKRGRVYNLDELRAAVTASICFTDVCRLVNVTACTFNFRRIRALCKQHEISLAHFDAKRAFRRNKIEWRHEDIFCERSRYCRQSLRQAAIKYGLYTGKCSECGIKDWKGKPLTIELDHINGINDDNRIENLRWLCPNCHSQTVTYKRSNVRRKTELQ